MRRIVLFLATIAGLWNTATAQTGGQFCVQAFEDRNANGQQDAGEPVLTRGIAINLLNEQGVIIQSALLENSPRAAFGEYCFQLLPAGQYSVVITSADYTATTPDTMTAAISENGTPALAQFGGQRVAAGTSVSTASPVVSAQQQREQLAQLVLAGLGALVVIAAMVVLGVVVYFVAFRNRLQAAAAVDARRTTGSMRTVPTTDTGEIARPTDDTE